MARRGRPRKSGVRQPCGRIRQPTAAERAAAALARLNAEKNLVLAQPHRRQFGDDQLAESPLGRFVLSNRLPRELHESGTSYARLWRHVRADLCAPVPLPESSLASLGVRSYPNPPEIDPIQIHEVGLPPPPAQGPARHPCARSCRRDHRARGHDREP
jgi:hypothetical protein